MAQPTASSPLSSPSHSTLHNIHHNVVAYGADPTGVADSTAAIQAAIDATNDANVVFFPAGTYKITSALEVGSATGFAQEIRGQYASYAGANAKVSTTIVQHTLSAKILNVTVTPGQTASLYIRDIKLTHASDATSGGHGIYMSPGGFVTGLTLENVEIQHSDIGAVVDSVVQPVFRNVSFNDTQTCAVDLILTNLPTFENCYFQAGPGAGLRVSSLVYDLRMDSCVFEGYTGPGLQIGTAGSLRNATWDGCWWEFPSTAGMISIDGQTSGDSGYGWNFNGCYFDGSTGAGGRDVITNTTATGSNARIKGLTFTGCAFYNLNGGYITRIAQAQSTGSTDPGYVGVSFIGCMGTGIISGVHNSLIGGSPIVFQGPDNGPSPAGIDSTYSYGGVGPTYVDMAVSGNTTANGAYARGIKSNGWWQGAVIPTASLPTAAAALDGSILIEDAGGGDRNLIIYAGGERFRIDGGANV